VRFQEHSFARLLRSGLYCGALLGLVSAAPLGLSTAYAQDEEPEDGDAPQDRNVLMAKAYEAARKGNWKEVSDAITELEGTAGNKPDGRLLYLKAKAFYEQGKSSFGKKGKGAKLSDAQRSINDSKDALKSLLEEHPDHVEGTYLYAMIEAKSNNETEAKGRLIRAAARGRYVLHDLNSTDGQATFKGYLKDPEFILDVMNAASEFQVNVKSLRNPFASPIRRVVDDGGTDTPVLVGPTVGPRLKQLEAQIDKIFAKIDELAKRQDATAMSLKFQELRALMNEYGSEGSEVAKEKLNSWKQKLIQYGDLYLSIQLQIYIQEGNQHLKAMAKALEEEEWDLALQRFEDIKELVDQMKAEDRDVFRRNAKALLVRGKSLAEEASRMKRIAEFTLRITGIILAPPEDERQKDSAIIDDRIYYEQDKLIDKETEDEIPDLEVVEILKSRVRFRYQGTEFVRGLERPDENKKDEEKDSGK
jgi:hypothetical protein